jgi:2-iminobutanoate/2-iminopropanoate deaminase
MRKIVTGPPSVMPTGSYSQAIIAKGTFIFTAGQVGRDITTGKTPDGIGAQTRQALENLRATLRAAGADLSDVVRMLVFLADLKDAPGFNEVYLEYFTSDRPVRARVQAGALSRGSLVEMEAIAVLPEESNS